MGPKKIRGKFRITENTNFNLREAVPLVSSALIGATAGGSIVPKVWGDDFIEKYIYSNDDKIETELFTITGSVVGACIAVLLCMMIMESMNYYAIHKGKRGRAMPIADAVATVPVRSNLPLQAATLVPKTLGNMVKYTTMILGSSVMYRFMKSVTEPLMDPTKAFACTALICAAMAAYFGVELHKDREAMKPSFFTPERVDLKLISKDEKSSGESAANDLKNDFVL